MGLRVNKGVKNRGVIEYIKGDKIYGFYPKENKWKYMDKTIGYYYTLDIIK